jgi:dihydrofolate reductase
MKIALIAAMAQNSVIGKNNRMPWHLSADLRRFKSLTTGHSIIMGRKTYASLGKPLPNRRNIVVTRSLSACEEIITQGVTVVTSIADALALCANEAEVFVIGGGEIYRQTIAMAHKIYLTIIHQDFEGDAFFPRIPPQFIQTSSEQQSENGLKFSFCLYEKSENPTP